MENWCVQKKRLGLGVLVCNKNTCPRRRSRGWQYLPLGQRTQGLVTGLTPRNSSPDLPQTGLWQLGIHTKTVDAAVWHLTFIVHGRTPVSFSHHFSLFGSDDDHMADEESRQFENLARDYAATGVSISDEFLDSSHGLTFQEAVERFRHFLIGA